MRSTSANLVLVSPQEDCSCSDLELAAGPESLCGGDLGAPGHVHWPGLSSMNMDDYLDAIDGVLEQDEKASLPSNIVSRPSARSIYKQRKEYAYSISRGNNHFHYRVQHLLTYHLDNDMTNIQECLKQLQMLHAEGKVWVQDMILQVENEELTLSDLESRDSLENIPLQNIEGFHSQMGKPPYKSVLAVTFRNQKNPSVMLFQCDEQPATIVQSNFEKVLGQFKENQKNKDSLRSKIQSTLILSNASEREPSLQTSTVFESPLLSRRGKETPQDSPVSQRRSGPINFHPPSQNQSLDSEHAEIVCDIDVLNHVLEDIEIFVRNLDSSKSNKKGKSLLSESDFFACLQKSKYAFNLLGKLQAYMSQPSATDMVHMLLNILPKIVSKCPRKNISSSVLSPFPTQKALLLLSSCMTDKERIFWESLGDSWSRTRANWPNGRTIPPYVPTFSDGWTPSRISKTNQQGQSDMQTAPRYPKSQQHVNPEYMKILCDFEARNERELSVKKGEHVKILDQSRQWWLVENRGNRRGFVPSNILESTNNEQVPMQPVSLQPSSSPVEVTAWLKDKGFSRITVKSLGVLTGDQLLDLSREELKAVCPEEGGRVFAQLIGVKSMLGI